MKQQNLVSAAISPDDVQAVLAAIATIHQKLPFLIGLSAGERRALPKMGPKTRDFVGNVLTVAAQNQDAIPRGLSVEEAQRDLALRDAMGVLNQAMQQLLEVMESTEFAAGSDAYSAALMIYQSLKMTGRGDGLELALDSWSKHFARRRATDEATTPAQTTATGQTAAAAQAATPGH